MSTNPSPPSKTNINTWLSVAGFALTIFAGVSALSSFRTSTELSLMEMNRKTEELKAQQSRDTARLDARAQTMEAAINTLNIRDARNDERMNSILETLRRIDAKLTAQELREKGGQP